jgi:hypothetical protein
VDVNRSRLVFLGLVAGADVTVAPVACRVVLTDGVTVTALVDSTSAGTARVVGYEVIEYAPNVIRAIRRGTIATSASTTGTDTITAVDMDKSTTDHLGFTSSGALTGPASAQVRVDLTNATTVTATSIGSVDRTVGYQVIWWN